MSEDTCRYCGLVGHWAKDCRKKKREEAYLVQSGAGAGRADEALLSIQACDLPGSAAPQLTTPTGYAQSGVTVPTTSARPMAETASRSVAEGEVQSTPTQLPTKIHWVAQWDLPIAAAQPEVAQPDRLEEVVQSEQSEDACTRQMQSEAQLAELEENLPIAATQSEDARFKQSEAREDCPEGSARPQQSATPRSAEEQSANTAITQSARPVAPSGGLFLLEEKAQVDLADLTQEGDTNNGVWVLDTGATSHMTGDRTMFAELDTSIVGTVKFGDGSVVDICGQGTVLFVGRTNEHLAIQGVYWIPRLNTHIISLGQLDEIGFEVLIKGGVLRMRDREIHLLVKV